MNCDFRILRDFIWVVDPGEIFYLTSPSAFVKLLRIPQFADLQGSRDVRLYELDVGAQNDFSRTSTIQTIRGYKRSDHNQTGICHQFCNLGDATDVFHSVFSRKSKVGVQAVTNIVSVQNIDLHMAVE